MEFNKGDVFQRLFPNLPLPHGVDFDVSHLVSPWVIPAQFLLVLARGDADKDSNILLDLDELGDEQVQ